MTDSEFKGDDHLSGMDHKLWSMHHEMLMQFQMYTMFKHQMWNCREWTEGLILWFVPADHPSADVAVGWLQHELEREFMEADEHLPGRRVSVQVMKFKGVNPHCDRDTCEALGKQMWERMQQELKNMKEKD